MAEVRPLAQFSVFLVNKPGVLAQVTGALAQAKVNLVAVTLVDSQEHGVLRMVAEDPAQARQVLAKLNLPMTETDVLCVDLPNRPGALSDVATQLGKEHININYAYVTSGAPGGRTTGVFKVADQAKALHVLKKAGGKHKEPPNLRRGAGGARR
ncbi:MAG TPA: ACT domain-containing protein [Tepidisphaeraceae bacterium]|nr:ACT domain-containing protein [Tepidisphaeraceae bacterium]